MIEALRTGNIAVSRTFQLARDSALPENQRQMSLVMAAPAYGPPADDGFRTFKGWIVVGLRSQDFIGKTLQEASAGTVDASLWAADEANNSMLVSNLSAGHKNDLHRETTLPLATKEWTLQLDASSRALPGTDWRRPYVVAIFGVGLSLLLSLLVFVLATGRRRALALVDVRTQELEVSAAESQKQTNILQTILDNITEGVVVVNAGGEILVGNTASKDMLGVDELEYQVDVSDHHYGVFFPDGKTRMSPQEFPSERALQGESLDDVEVLVYSLGRPDGILLSVSARPIDLPTGRASVSVFHDITKMRRYENELKSFAGVVAHDLKAPLTTVNGFAELLHDELLTGSASPHAINAIERIVLAATACNASLMICWNMPQHAMVS